MYFLLFSPTNNRPETCHPKLPVPSPPLTPAQAFDPPEITMRARPINYVDVPVMHPNEIHVLHNKSGRYGVSLLPHPPPFRCGLLTLLAVVAGRVEERATSVNVLPRGDDVSSGLSLLQRTPSWAVETRRIFFKWKGHTKRKKA